MAAISRGRNLRRASSTSSSSSTSPERHSIGDDGDDGDSFMLQGNDSVSSLGLSTHDPAFEDSQTEAARREWEERCRVSPVHRLPAELLISIFARLSAPKDLQTCLLVCKEWAKNSVGLLWHRPALNKWPSIHSVVGTLRSPNPKFAYPDLIKRLNLSTLGPQVSDGTLLGLTGCKRVERLTLTNCSRLTDMSLQPLLAGNRSLLALDITGLDQLSDATLETVADHSVRLQGLNTTNCRRLTDHSIVAIARNCRHLKRLKFNACVQLTDISIITIAAHSTHLLEIDLCGLVNLESASVSSLLTSCPHLRELRLAHCSRITDSSFLDIPLDGEGGRRLEALRILDLTDCAELTDRSVERVIALAPRLRNLVLAKCRQLTDRSVFAISRLGKNLHYIHLGHCSRITDAGVEVLTRQCSRIRYIDLACCSNLTDQSVSKLAGLPKLKRVGLVKCAGITDHTIYALAMGEMKGGRRVHGGTSVLERVHLSYCTLLTLDGIHTLLSSCPRLTHLSLTGVQSFLREDLLHFCREAPPEFNEHQRDVFCVFSGPGVGRLREYLDSQKAYAEEQAHLARAATDSSVLDEELEDTLTGDEGDGGTPTMNLDVRSDFPPGATPIAGPSSGLLFGWGQNHGYPPASQGGVGSGGSAQHFSQSAPASSGMWHPAGPSTATAAAPPPPPPTQLFPLAHHAIGPWAGGGVGLGVARANTPGTTQQVTGMMGATVLEDLDEEVDETFDEAGSDTAGE